MLGECPQTDDDEQIFMYKYIHPKELIDLIERGQRNLLLDYRSNKEEKVTYRGAKKSYLVVVQIEPTQILPGYINTIFHFCYSIYFFIIYPFKMSSKKSNQNTEYQRATLPRNNRYL